jgi:hypothetical protein
MHSNVKEGYQAPIFDISTEVKKNNTSMQIEFNLSMNKQKLLKILPQVIIMKQNQVYLL